MVSQLLISTEDSKRIIQSIFILKSQVNPLYRRKILKRMLHVRQASEVYRNTQGKFIPEQQHIAEMF